MIQLIVGGKGSGKTKKMIDMINDSAKTTPGNIVCIEKSMKLTYDIDHAARLIDVDEYKISGYDMLYGFIAGIRRQLRHRGGLPGRRAEAGQPRSGWPRQAAGRTERLRATA